MRLLFEGMTWNSHQRPVRKLNIYRAPKGNTPVRLHWSLYFSDAMLSSNVVALILVAGVALWQTVNLVRKRILSSIIHNIPGPPASSFWTGLYTDHGLST